MMLRTLLPSHQISVVNLDRGAWVERFRGPRKVARP